MDAHVRQKVAVCVSIWTVLKMKKVMINIFLLMALIMSLTNCKEDEMCDDKLKMQRIDYTGNQLRIDGYYFGDANPSSSMPFANIYYLYRNGIFFTSEAADLDKAQEGTISVDVENSFGKKIKGAWGVFQVSNSMIEIERWQSAINGCETTVYEQGEILNDSTFVITHREFRKNGKATKTVEPNSEFHFRPLPQKPDSTNSFIQ